MFIVGDGGGGGGCCWGMELESSWKSRPPHHADSLLGGLPNMRFRVWGKDLGLQALRIFLELGWIPTWSAQESKVGVWVGKNAFSLAGFRIFWGLWLLVQSSGLRRVS